VTHNNSLLFLERDLNPGFDLTCIQRKTRFFWDYDGALFGPMAWAWVRRGILLAVGKSIGFRTLPPFLRTYADRRAATSIARVMATQSEQVDKWSILLTAGKTRLRITSDNKHAEIPWRHTTGTATATIREM
jgi:hypothetical protein